MLFEKPHKWNSSHRDLLRVKEDQVSSEELVGSAYLPQDGDQELETIAALFAGPEKESVVDGTVWFDYKESPFWSVFTILRDTMKLQEEEE